MIDDMAVYIANLGKYNEGYLVGIMDSVFLILFIQADFFFHIFLVNRKREPSTD